MNDGGQAFPVSDQGTHGSYGMTLRDYLAAKAMQGILANPDQQCMNMTPEQISQNSYAYADSMLRERDKKEAKG